MEKLERAARETQRKLQTERGPRRQRAQHDALRKDLFIGLSLSRDVKNERDGPIESLPSREPCWARRSSYDELDLEGREGRQGKSELLYTLDER
ncbi:hypothetical protein EVAR_38467_1 [Eumeta japonica]|uniref:Uncharacterized protein n=1 Tax=Eumeta variegata TaxID=151549 RepID=A0A4C1WM14_EUMVA|nr:hypothetical protein EVAR_38467_1 [Eumeta japonica]